MPNTIVWLNEYAFENNALTTGASQVTAGPDGRYAILFHYLSGFDDTSGGVFNANGFAFNFPFGLVLADPVNFPDVTYLPDGRIVMAWTQTTGGNQDIYFKVINGDAQGYTPFSPAPILANSGAVAGNQTRPTVTGLANGNIALSWFDANDNHQKVRVFDILGNPVSGVIDASPVSGADAAFAVNSSATLIMLDNGGFAVGFVDAIGESRMSVFNASGVVVALEIDLIVGGGNDDFGQPTLAQLADGRIAAVTSSLSGTGLVVRFFSDAGAALSAEIFIALPGVDAGEDEAPRIAALNDGRFMVVFGKVEGSVDSDIWGVIIKADGTVDGAPFRVNDTAGPGTGSQSAPSIATLADGRVVVSWTDNNTGNGDIVQKIYDPREAGLSGSASSMSDDWYGTGFADTIYMGLGNDLFHGAAGNDYVYGEGGNDTLYGGDGADYIKGGNGNDTISGADGANALTDTGDVWLSGEAGNDTIYGEAGDDRIDGGDGIDMIYGGDARDYITAGNGNDTIYGGDEAGAGDRWLGGEGGDDVIYGGDGDDRIDGGDGVDVLNGNNGNDYITAGAGGDVIFGGNEAVGGDAYLAGDAGVDTIYGGDGNDRIDGGTEGDFLIGGNGQDTITGAAGDDYIEGGAATDGLYGGAGLDTFDYNSGCGTDNIYDFADDVDTIQIDPSFGLSVAQVLAATSIFGNHAYINLGGGNGMIVLNWISGGHTISQLGDDILIA
jgi:Ca2+-binding RTX toxin-like protein